MSLKSPILATLILSSFFIGSATASLQDLAAILHRLNLTATISKFSENSDDQVIKISKTRMARQFVIAHNMVRSVFGFEPLKWNRTLAKYARRWAYHRIDDCALQHSADSPYGENMFWSLKGNWGPLEVVKVWADEYVFYDQNQNECIHGGQCGHYTQVVWKNTQQLGCGRVECNNEKGFLYVCSYYPPGNIYFQGPFGGHFSKCIVNPPHNSN